MDNPEVRPDVATGIRDWLIEDAGFLEHFGLVVEGLCARLVAAGVPLARVTAHIRVVHSERVGITRVWQRGKATIEQHFGFGQEVEDMYQRSRYAWRTRSGNASNCVRPIPPPRHSASPPT
jgi:adenylate cyclase